MPLLIALFDALSVATTGRPLSLFYRILVISGILIPVGALALIEWLRKPPEYDKKAKQSPFPIITLFVAVLILYPFEQHYTELRHLEWRANSEANTILVINGNGIKNEIVSNLSAHSGATAVDGASIDVNKTLSSYIKCGEYPGSVYSSDVQTGEQKDRAVSLLMDEFTPRFWTLDWRPSSLGSKKSNYTLPKEAVGMLVRSIARFSGIKIDDKGFDNSLGLYTRNVDSFNEYIKGLDDYSNYTKDGMDSAIQHLSKSIEFDPKFSLAYSALADCYSQLYLRYWASPAEIRNYLDTGMRLAERAKHLGGADARIYKAHALICMSLANYYMRKHNYEENVTNKKFILDSAEYFYLRSKNEYVSALKIDPKFFPARNNLAMVYAGLSGIAQKRHDFNTAKQFLMAGKEELLKGIQETKVFPPFSINLGFLLLEHFNLLTDSTLNKEVNRAGEKIKVALQNLLDSAILVSQQGISLSGNDPAHKGIGFYNLACSYSRIAEIALDPSTQAHSLDEVKRSLESSIRFNGMNFYPLLVGSDSIMVKKDPDLEFFRNSRDEDFKSIIDSLNKASGKLTSTALAQVNKSF
jgi:hypothetical protein